VVAESYLSLWDLFWALVSPILALYLRDVDLQFDADWSAVVWLQEGMTRYFSVHEALDIAEAVLFAELMTFAVLFTLTRLDGIPRSIPLVHGLLLAVGPLAARVFVRIMAREDNDWMRTRR
jgi:FlaA1/EpsC-like NDP-sugar epimerase